MNPNQTYQLQELIKWTKEHIKDSNNSEMIHNITPEDRKIVRFQILVGTLISARTTDAISEAAFTNLLKIDGGLSCENVIKTDKSVIEECISKVSFRKRKAQNIVDIAKTMIEKYDGDIPKSKDELLDLPGIGEKCANLIMSEAWNENAGITVDTHVHRLANRLNFVKTKNPNATSQKLSEIIDKDLWKDASQALYYFGQQICQAKKPQCENCIISDCPSRK